MKNRIIAILLAMTLLLCALPVFAAAENVEPKLYVFAESHLRDMNYSDYETRTELAVGDALYIIYEDTEPANVLIDGKTVCSFKANEYQSYQYDVKETGSFNLTIRSGGGLRFSRTYTVISSAEMYRKSLGTDLKEALSLRMDPFLLHTSLDELKDAANNGFPVGNPFLPFAAFAMMFYNVFSIIFSFFRIVR